MALKVDTSVTKGSKRKVRVFLRLIPTFVKVKEEKLVKGREGTFWVKWDQGPQHDLLGHGTRDPVPSRWQLGSRIPKFSKRPGILMNNLRA